MTQTGQIDPQAKGAPIRREKTTYQSIGSLGWTVCSEDLTTPFATLDLPAVDHNIRQLQQFCDASGVLLAPHGKTTMAPEIFRRQLDAGAWGMTAATPHQLKLYRDFGVDRVLVANPLVDRNILRWLRLQLEDDPSFECLLYVDSDSTLAAIGGAFHGFSSANSPGLLIELGYEGGRTGVRSAEMAIALARKASRVDGVRVVGLAGYEGTMGGARSTEIQDRIDRYLAELRTVALRFGPEGLVGDGPTVVTAGGSAWFDRVVAVLRDVGRPNGDLKIILRSGAYVSHDDGICAECSPTALPGWAFEGLRPALHIWGSVISVPETGLAIVDVGARDVGSDAGLPVAKWLASSGTATAIPIDSALVVGLNDQHCYVRAPGGVLSVGDRIGLGISHPCTTFDKWQLVYWVEESHSIVGAFRTYF